MDTAAPEFVSTFIFPEFISFGHRKLHDEANMCIYFLSSQGPQNYELHNILLNLLLGAQTFVYQKT